MFPVCRTGKGRRKFFRVKMHWMQTRIAVQKAFSYKKRTYTERPYVPETYGHFHFRSMSSMVAHFPSFPEKNGKCAKEETAAQSLRPKICRPSADGMKLARCARSDSHSVWALRAFKSSPCGVGLRSNGRGSCTRSHLFVFRRCGLRHIAIWTDSLYAVTDAARAVRSAGAGLYPSWYFPACPWKCCAAASQPRNDFIRSLFWKIAGQAERDAAHDIMKRNGQQVCAAAQGKEETVCLLRLRYWP